MRIFSYNIHKGIGGRDRRYLPERVVDAIAAESPDIVCLQEVDQNVRRSRFHDQPAMLAEMLGLKESVYQRNVSVGAGGYGNLILSRYPLIYRDDLCLRQGWRKPRAAQIVLAETAQGPLRLVNWHLGLAERERHWQVRKLLGDERFAEQDQMPSLIIGDSNDWRNTLAAGPFADAGYTKLTWPPRTFRSFPAYLPVGALDKAFARGDLAVREARVVKTALTREASDHLPLLLELDLWGAKPGA